jgi:hypothetical protein
MLHNMYNKNPIEQDEIFLINLLSFPGALADTFKASF